MARLSPNRDLLLAVARSIAPLLPDIVFVGGQVADLLVTSPEAEQIRATHDVDVVVAAATKLEYRRVEDRLTDLGLQPDTTEAAPVCRWRTPEGLKLDVMPADRNVLGFGNPWFPAVLEQATPYRLTDDVEIRIPTAPLFLATKWAAFQDRGNDDVISSHDIEDIITVVAGRGELAEEIESADPDLREWLAAKTADFLANPDSSYALEGALTDARRIQGLVKVVRDRFEAMVAPRA